MSSSSSAESFQTRTFPGSRSLVSVKYFNPERPPRTSLPTSAGTFVQMLKSEVHNAIARITLDRPEIHNALNEEMIRLLTKTFREFGSRSDVRAIVLQGNGKSFSAGADLNWTK